MIRENKAAKEDETKGVAKTHEGLPGWKTFQCPATSIAIPAGDDCSFPEVMSAEHGPAPLDPRPEWAR
jgi:hypothetical protein